MTWRASGPSAILPFIILILADLSDINIAGRKRSLHLSLGPYREAC
jgi:hypothetical protein